MSMRRIKQFLLILLATALLLLFLEVVGRALFFQKKAAPDFGILYLSRQIGTYIQNTILSRNKSIRELTGLPLNKKAWQASFQERGVTPPYNKPREGYWGRRVNPKKKEKFLRYVERPVNIPERVHVDKEGFQYAAVAGHIPEYTILILGGSVAYGAYASSAQNTYFSQLVNLLAKKKIYVEIYVLAAGSWVSTDELMALVLKGLDKSPDMVVFFNGLNDLTNAGKIAGPQPADTWLSPVTKIDTNYANQAAGYLDNMEKAKKIASAFDMTIVFAIQPFLPAKNQLTPLEQQILKTTKKARKLVPYYKKLRRGLKRLHDGRQAFFIDCSTVFDAQKQTTFTDIWHFTDPGHSLIAKHLSENMDDIIHNDILQEPNNAHNCR